MNTGEFTPSDVKDDKPIILFVGDHVCFSDIYLRLIGEEFGHFHVFCDRDVEAAERRVLTDGSRIAIVVVAGRFGTAALTALRRIVEAAPTARPVLAYGTLAEINVFLASSDGNALLEQLSFLPMRANIDAIVSIIHLLVSGECHVTSEVMQVLLDARTKQTFNAAPGCPAGGVEACPIRISSNNQEDICALTAREMQVLSLLSEGQPNKSIAEKLALSQSTVKLHTHHIIAKLGVRNRTEAAVAFLGFRLSANQDSVT